MANLFVRIAKGKQAESFFRAGMSFTKEWQAVEVDDATAGRLYAEQMLEVTDVNPDADQLISVEFNQTDPVQTENDGAGINQTDATAQSTEASGTKEPTKMAIDNKSTVGKK